MPDMPRTHWAFGVTESRGKIIVVGGAGAGGVIPGRGGLAPQVEVFDPGRRHWSSLPGLRTPRHHVTAVAMGNRIFTFNGSTALTPPEGTRIAEVLDLPLPSPDQTMTEFTAPFRGASLGLSNGKITTVTTARSRALGSFAVVGTATAGGQESKGDWTFFTTHGAIYSKVAETTHLSSSGATLDGVATITGGTERYRGATGWFNIGETLASDLKGATGTLDGVVIVPRR
jgi:hypothetical protein